MKSCVTSIQEWAECTSMHGPPEANRSEHWCECLFWICLTFGGVAAAVWSCWGLMGAFDNQDVSTQMQYMCPKELGTADDLMAYDFLYCPTDWFNITRAMNDGYSVDTVLYALRAFEMDADTSRGEGGAFNYYYLFYKQNGNGMFTHLTDQITNLSDQSGFSTVARSLTLANRLQKHADLLIEQPYDIKNASKLAALFDELKNRGFTSIREFLEKYADSHLKRAASQIVKTRQNRTYRKSRLCEHLYMDDVAALENEFYPVTFSHVLPIGIADGLDGCDASIINELSTTILPNVGDFWLSSKSRRLQTPDRSTIALGPVVDTVPNLVGSIPRHCSSTLTLSQSVLADITSSTKMIRINRKTSPCEERDAREKLPLSYRSKDECINKECLQKAAMKQYGCIIQNGMNSVDNESLPPCTAIISKKVQEDSMASAAINMSNNRSCGQPCLNIIPKPCIVWDQTIVTTDQSNGPSNNTVILKLSDSGTNPPSSNTFGQTNTNTSNDFTLNPPINVYTINASDSSLGYRDYVMATFYKEVIINLMSSENKFLVVTEIPLLTLESLIAQIGGNVGLYTGASFLTIIHVAVSIMKHFLKRLRYGVMLDAVSARPPTVKTLYNVPMRMDLVTPHSTV